MTMDTVRVLVEYGSDNWTLTLSRVPTVGERVRILDQIYAVNTVVHTPNAAHSAEVTVTLVR